MRGSPAGGGTDRNRAAWVLLGGVILVWGCHWTVAKLGLETIPPLTYALSRLVTGSIVLAVLMAWRGRLQRPVRADLPVIVSYGLLAVAASILLMNLALLTAPAGRSSILAYTLPLWVVPLTAIVTAVLPTRWEAAGLVLGLGGLVLLLNPLAIDWGSPDALPASGALLLAAFVSAVAIVHVRAHRWQGTPFDAQLWQLLVALVPVGVMALLLEQPWAVHWDLGMVLVVLYGGPLATAFAYWASQSAILVVGPVATSIVYLAVPVVGVAAGALVLGEQVLPIDLAGMAVTGAGVALVVLGRRDRAGGSADPPEAVEPDRPSRLASPAG